MYGRLKKREPEIVRTAKRICCQKDCMSLNKDFYTHPSNPHWLLCKPCYEAEINRRYQRGAADMTNRGDR